MRSLLISLAICALSICLGAEPLPRIAVLPTMAYQGHGHHAQTNGAQGLHRRVASDLLQSYHCQIVSRNNMLVFDQERVIRSLQERSPDFVAIPVAADYVILSFIERQSGALRLHFAKVAENMRLSKPLFIPKGGPDDLQSKVPAEITNWIATNLGLSPKEIPGELRQEKIDGSKRVWAVLPIDAPTRYLGEYNDVENAQSIYLSVEMAVAEADPEATMVDRTAIAEVIREWELEHLQGSHQHSLASHVLGVNVALQAVVSYPNSKKAVRFDLIAIDPLTGTIVAARSGEKSRKSFGQQVFAKEISSLLDEISQADLPTLRKERDGDGARRQQESHLHFQQASLPMSKLERMKIGGSARLINAESAASLLRPRNAEDLQRIGHLSGFLYPLIGWETSKIADHEFAHKVFKASKAEDGEGAAYFKRLNSLFNPVTDRLLALDTPEAREQAARIQSNLANYEEALRISEIDREEILKQNAEEASLRSFISAKSLIGLKRYAEAIDIIRARGRFSVDQMLMLSDCYRLLGNA